MRQGSGAGARAWPGRSLGAGLGLGLSALARSPCAVQIISEEALPAAGEDQDNW